MGSFPIIDPYPEDSGTLSTLSSQGTTDAEESDSDEFEIDSDVSDDDLLLLKSELKRAESTKTQRDLAAATVELQRLHFQRWERYCAFLRKPALSCLKKCNASAFKGYLIWYHKQHPRARRLNTFESVWKGIRQVYYDTYGVVVGDSVGKEVAKFLNGPFCDEQGLIRGSLPKHTVGYNGILGALYYHWIFDTETFPTERDRIHLAFFILLLAYTGSRPGAIVESDIRGIRGTNEALKYKDINLTLVRPSDGSAPLLVMKVRIVPDKGRRHRGEHKTLTLYENYAGTSEPQLLQILGHRKIETYQKHYQSTDVVVDVQATFLGSTSKSDMIKEIGKLCLRQDPDLPRRLTKEQKLQARCQPEIQRLERRRDALTQELKVQFGRIKDGSSTPQYAERRSIMSRLSSRRAQAEKEYFQRVLREFHDTADLNLMVSQLEGKNTLVGLRLPADFVFEERRRLATILFKESTEASFAQIVEDLCQLCTRQEQRCSGRVSLLQTSIAKENTLEHSTAAESPSMGVQVTAGETMAVDFNSLSVLDSTKPHAGFRVLEDVVESSELPITSALRKQPNQRTRRRRTCLFCASNHKHGQTRTFARTYTLRQHYQNVHFQYQVGCFICPVPGCQQLIPDRKMFANHAVAVHKNDIGIRATLKESVNREKKPGKLLAFTL
ncbi:MAG: hypothetical protein Q9166_008119 [cf. Caloplaca sp. 2 TL-2023]